MQGAASLKPVPAAECTSPVQICGEGRFSGGLTGSFSSVLFTLTPTADATGVLRAVRTFVDPTGGGILYLGQICVP